MAHVEVESLVTKKPKDATVFVRIWLLAWSKCKTYSFHSKFFFWFPNRNAISLGTISSLFNKGLTGLQINVPSCLQPPTDSLRRSRGAPQSYPDKAVPSPDAGQGAAACVPPFPTCYPSSLLPSQPQVFNSWWRELGHVNTPLKSSKSGLLWITPHKRRVSTPSERKGYHCSWCHQ